MSYRYWDEVRNLKVSISSGWIINALFILICPYRYGSLNDAQVSQSDVVELEQEFNVTVLRIRYQNSKVGALSALSNESALILNLVCDKLFVHCLKGNRPVTDTVMI